MKISIMFKTPDATHYALEDVADIEQREEVEEKLKKWIKDKECVRLEYDTEEDTLIVKKQ